jgi:hypothetical protein
MKIFLSAVSGQFKECRDALASDLRAVGAEVVVQEDFQQQGRTLLEKLERYIASCDRVIALIGDAYGWEPDPGATPGLPQRSYTQWEYAFARGERLLTERQPAIDIYVYFASPTFLTSHPVAQEAGATQRQTSFVAEVCRSGKDRSEFGSINELRALVLRDGFRMPSRNHEHLNQTAAALRLVPRPPLVGFIPRRDPQGRDILGRLKQELNPARNQLVALWGPGGVGKTALAAQAARDWAAEYGSRVVWIGADHSADFTLDTLLDAIASQLGTADLDISKDKKDRVRALLAEAASLIVLDNLETVSPEEQESCVSWLADTASCTALLTTRDSLSFKRQGINLALNIVVEAMTKDEASQFVERHAALADNPEAIARVGHDEVIHAADGNPLVMQWIVAQIGLAQSPATVLEQLAQGKGGAVERVFDRSFNLPQLGDDGRAALLALSLFVSSASRQALAAVAGSGTDLGRLNEAVKRLAALRLLSTVDDGERLTVQGLTRELTQARLAGDPRADEFRYRIVDFFLHYAQAHARATREDVDALKVEEGNLLGAMDLAVASLTSALDEPGSLVGIADVFARPAGAAFKTIFLKGATGAEQPRARSEYENIGRAALASLLLGSGPTDDARRLPMTDDTTWHLMLDAGPPSFGHLFEGRGFNPVEVAVVTSDYLLIVWWAEAMSAMARVLRDLLHFLEGVPKPETDSNAFKELRKQLSRHIAQVRHATKPHFGEPWHLLVMVRSLGLQNATAH